MCFNTSNSQPVNISPISPPPLPKNWQLRLLLQIKIFKHNDTITLNPPYCLLPYLHEDLVSALVHLRSIKACCNPTTPLQQIPENGSHIKYLLSNLSSMFQTIKLRDTYPSSVFTYNLCNEAYYWCGIPGM